MGALEDFLHRQTKGRGRGDVAQVNYPGPRRHATPKLFNNLICAVHRQRNGLMNVSGAGFTANKIPGIVTGTVLMISSQNFFTRLEGKRMSMIVMAKPLKK